MGFEYQAKKPKDLSKINPNDFPELLWWSYILRVSPERLMAVIDEVGRVTVDVKALLHK